jgi:hypothetical protein
MFGPLTNIPLYIFNLLSQSKSIFWGNFHAFDANICVEFEAVFEKGKLFYEKT